MKLSFDYKGIKVTYYLTYKKAKAISINITGNGVVNVVAPRGTSVFSVMDKVKGHAPWIINELYGKAKATAEPKLLDQYMYLGKNYKLEMNVVEDATCAKVKMTRGKFVVQTSDQSPQVVRAAIVEWYKQKVTAKLKEKMKEFGEHFEIRPSIIQVVDNSDILFKSNRDEITVNVKLGILPIDVIDYIVVNSLCRLNTKDEESELRQLETILPNYIKSKEWLEANKDELAL